MIENPVYVSRSEKTAPVNLGINVDPFNRKDSHCSQVWYDGIVGIKWESNKCEHHFLFKRLFAYPTPDMERMVVLLFSEEAEYPNNAIFLNDIGEITYRPQIPIRLSKKDKWLPKGELEFFAGCGWSQYDDYLYFYFPIGESDWRETRFFNYKTMEWDNERYESWRL